MGARRAGHGLDVVPKDGWLCQLPPGDDRRIGVFNTPLLEPRLKHNSREIPLNAKA